jgi:signal peptidase I
VSAGSDAALDSEQGLPAETAPGAVLLDGSPAPSGGSLTGTGTGKGSGAGAKSGFREYAQSLLVTLVLALYGTTFIVQAFKIPSKSMEPTLLVGDHLLVNKFIFEGRGAWYEHLLPYREIRRGDIIVFKFPYADHPHFVKRVIGLPGDRLRIFNQEVYVNGLRLNEPYVVHTAPDPFADNFPPHPNDYFYSSLQPEWADDIQNHIRNGELLVPPHKYFAMGDNRDQSLDSRYWGFVDRDAIMGRPVIVYWSVAATSQDYEDNGEGGNLSGIGHILMHLPSATRWRRMFHEVH